MDQCIVSYPTLLNFCTSPKFITNNPMAKNHGLSIILYPKKQLSMNL